MMYHYLGKEKGMPEGGYGIHITAELKGPDKRCQVQKEGLQIIVLMTILNLYHQIMNLS